MRLTQLFLVFLSLVACRVGVTFEDGKSEPLASAAADAETAISKFKIAPGLKCSLFAAEPQVCNITAFSIDERGRFFVVETFRKENGVLDIREFHGNNDWLDEDVASKTVDDRLALLRRYKGANVSKLGEASERVRLVEDRAGTGKADYSTVFADGFNTIVDGTAEGIFARKGLVYFADIPNLWLLKNTKGEGKADYRKSLHYGYGIRIGFQGHDLHGIRMGPDGKIYLSIGDRAVNIKTEDRSIVMTDCGGVLRCNPDGSDLEIFATGLRNPQCLTFDQYGNLFTGDNNSDSGDRARWVYVTEGSDSGWRYSYQLMEHPSRGPFNSEKIWHLQFDGQPAYITPPVALIANGPAGTTYYPGTGLPARYNEHFFLVDFTGGAGSGIFSFAMKPKGATFELVDREHIIREVLATHCDFGPDGGLYLSDWVEGWVAKGKGRIYRLFDPELAKSELVLNTKKLINEGMDKRSDKELAELLAYPDLRVRQEAQFALADRGAASIETLAPVAIKNANLLARLHAIWGLGQIGRTVPAALTPLLPLLADEDAEVKAQATKVLSERRVTQAYDGIEKLLQDSSARVRFFAALGLGKFGRKEAVSPVLAMLRENADRDTYLRHAGVMALVGIGDMDSLLAASKDESAAVRMAVLLAWRRMERADVAMFLKDKEPAIVLEAARAISDLPLSGALPDLALLLDISTDSEPLLRRTINANFRIGGADAAARLVRFAAKDGPPHAMRIEALQALHDWPRPSGRDRVTGMWRPIVIPRDKKTPADALRSALVGFIHDAPEDIRVAAVQAAGALDIEDPVLFETVANKAQSEAVRAEALKALAVEKDSHLVEGLKICVGDASALLRKEAIELLVKLDAGQAAERLISLLDTGTVPEKQFAMNNLGGLQVPTVDATVSKWMDKLLGGDVPKELQLDVLNAAAKRQTPEIKAKAAKYDSMRSKDDPLSAWRESLFGGDAASGKKIFFEKQEASCLRCHKIAGRGGEVGPQLTGIGARQPREYILESIMLPNKVIAKGFESITVKMKDAKVISGTLKSENETDLVLNTPNEGAVSLKKSEIAIRKIGLSAMPEDIGQKLSKSELRDMVEYLATQK